MAEGRWKILRSALLGHESQENGLESSIHRFSGWNLLPKEPEIVGGAIDNDDCSVIRDIETLVHRVLALQCTRGDKNNLSLAVKSSSIFLDPHNQKQVREKLGRYGILARFKALPGHERSFIILNANWSFCTFIGYRYRLTDKSFALIRERKPRRKVALRELVSHDLNHGVDNTGQRCVWDSEATLTYCLLNKASALRQLLLMISNLSSTHRILELGVGMAGLAGMALAKIVPTSVLLTDGHPDAILNNKVNIQMNTFCW
jgi:hypothetical protein